MGRFAEPEGRGMFASFVSRSSLRFVDRTRGGGLGEVRRVGFYTVGIFKYTLGAWCMQQYNGQCDTTCKIALLHGCDPVPFAAFARPDIFTFIRTRMCTNVYI